jgi:hypothetical protein
MKWIELIVVRAADIQHKPTIRRLVDQLARQGQSEGLARAALYHNAFVQTDIGIQLEWEAENGPPSKSPIGLELAAALEEFGRVHHTICVRE